MNQKDLLPRISDKRLAAIADDPKHPLSEAAFEEQLRRAEDERWACAMGLRDDTPSLDAPWWSER